MQRKVLRVHELEYKFPAIDSLSFEGNNNGSL